MYYIKEITVNKENNDIFLQKSDGKQYDAATAISILENGLGGAIINVKTGEGFAVSSKESENDKLRKQLNLNVTMYKILRPTLWFCKGDEIGVLDLEKYFTKEGLTQLIRYGFIEKLW